MARDGKVVIEEHRLSGENNLEKSFSVISNRSPTHEGYECYRTQARYIDDHYVLMAGRPTSSPSGKRKLSWKPFGVVESKSPSYALQRLYQEAERFAQKRAEQCKTEVVDMTSPERMSFKPVPHSHLKNKLKNKS